MQILACTDYYPPNTGGVEIAAANLYRELARQGHEITVLTLGSGRASHENITVTAASKIEVTKYLGLQSSVSVEFLGVFLATLRNGDYDLLHIHNRFFYTSSVAAFLSKVLDIPLVFSLHTSRIDMYSGLVGRAARLFEETICRATIRTADHVVCNSTATAEKARSLGADSESLSTHYHGVDTTKFTPPVDPPNQPLTLVYVGRLVRNKGVHSLATIFEYVAETVPDARLEIVGEGPLEDTLQDRLSDHSVRFHGAVPHDTIAEIYKQSHIFCLPSKSEGLSLTTLEAMATGLPVVVSDTGGLREIVRDGVTGYRIEPTATDRFSDTIITLWQNSSQRTQIGNSAREYVLENHSWTRRAEAIEAIFQRLVDDRVEI
jgi:glycosyltransferase involved in cell wall biosynthesis